MIITIEKVKEFWNSYWWLIFKWNLISFIGLATGGIIIASILRHIFKVKFKFWWLNYTEDGDFGADWWLEDNDTGWLIPNMILWWFRNHSWYYIDNKNPIWKDGDNEGYKLFINTIGDKIHNRDLYPDGIYTWLTKDIKEEQELYVAYVIEGKVYCRYSKVWKDWLGRWRQYQKGAGGDRYKLNRKPLI